MGDGPKINSEVQWAKDYYAQKLAATEKGLFSFDKLMSTNGSSDNMKANVKSPSWEAAVPGISNFFDFVETPLNNTSKKASAMQLSSSRNNTPQMNKDVVDATFDRLIIYRNDEGKINERIVTYIPDANYARSHQGNIKHNKINQLDEDFDGYLMYKTWEDELLFILRIEKGKAIKKY
ncbi:MAG: hypothetical protein EOO43_13255, partial [Flavobacterium sp.]